MGNWINFRWSWLFFHSFLAQNLCDSRFQQLSSFVVSFKSDITFPLSFSRLFRSIYMRLEEMNGNVVLNSMSFQFFSFVILFHELYLNESLCMFIRICKSFPNGMHQMNIISEAHLFEYLLWITSRKIKLHRTPIRKRNTKLIFFIRYPTKFLYIWD